MAAGADSAAEGVDVGSEAQLRGAGRMVVKVGPAGRWVFIVADRRGALHCIDATCYHMGGPLGGCDVEDLGEHGSCVTCPWHSYKISLTTGKKLFQGIDGKFTLSAKARQRVHRVFCAGGRVRVVLDPSEEEVESDTYAFKQPAPSMRTPVGPRSGQVFAGSAGVSPLSRMVGQSMYGADGRAPWMFGGGAMPAAGGGIGAMGGGGYGARPQGRPAGIILSDTATPFEVSGVERAGRNTVVLSLKCAVTCRSMLGSTGKHVLAQATASGIQRPLTPYFLPDDGDMKLLVKRYEGGALSPRLCSLQRGGVVLLQGPVPSGLRTGFFKEAKVVCMLAAGTGITPMLQVLYGGGLPSSLERVVIVCFNRSEPDILISAHLTSLRDRGIGRASVSLTHVLSHPDPPPQLPVPGEGWPPENTGRIGVDLLRRVLPPPDTPGVRLLYCGPPAFNELSAGLISALGYSDDMSHGFE
eukprot:Hpha_TRINITY_DN4300_c0_g1::TRINITY_DN4300_c0_g1_i1::g.50058::m.50058/K00326/E1.6.2.2; cytochrome-b5 reductase